MGKGRQEKEFLSKSYSIFWYDNGTWKKYAMHCGL